MRIKATGSPRGLAAVNVVALLPWLELGFITVVASLYVVFRQSLAFRAEFILPVGLLAAGYIAVLLAVGLRSLGDYGLTTAHLGPASRLTALVFAGPLVWLIWVGHVLQRPVPSHFWWTLMLYPLWGILQQLIFQGFILENLRRLGLRWLSVPLTAFAYSLVHYPSPLMLVFTALAGAGFSTIYYRTRNIIPLGIAHGILGACLYYFLYGHDPLQKLLGRLG